MASLATSPVTRAPARRHMAGVLHLIGALIVTFGSVAGASYAARWLLRGMPHSVATTAHAVGHTPAAPSHAAPPDGGAVAVGIGATQSYRGLAVTVTNLRLLPTNDFVAAPAGHVFACVTVILANTDPAQPAAYNAADFFLADPQGALHHEVFAALAAPLGAGSVPPRGRVQGDLAFLVTVPPAPYTPDPQLRFFPASGAPVSLAWDLPLTPIFP
jgi:hypothetical protein